MNKQTNESQKIEQKFSPIVNGKIYHGYEYIIQCNYSTLNNITFFVSDKMGLNLYCSGADCIALFKIKMK